ncbi:serine/threonine protein kinase [Aphanomyces invadans]|uniref:Serine/threonine protein kinase n=1 Tax=Aphanomyces invadans TaxID=157072 RepID=A0A024UK29_9STRA|nr:serine/threonine protein kinase [Aphanomyces invadans]ETW05943.1 serine/threonine protein kinase [Aphanomyces invadans]RHY31417.1 hypothetical protein DYB32_003506 [Aphanomyces invadans]|eukprot:XP_008865720.1 serine/threonine protein kinase [Aphanomyces invadans]
MHDRYIVAHEVAATSTSQVLLCTERLTGHHVIVKRIQVQFLAGVDASKMSLERQIHRRLSANGGHRHILTLLDDFSADGFDTLVLEYCGRGDLFTLVENAPDRRLAPPLVQASFAGICDAVHFMHMNGVAHGDLSLENVLVTDSGTLKLSDFGLATPIDTIHRNQHVAGKAFYMAPEMHVAHGTNDPAKADVWSLGVMLFMLVTGTPPFETSHASDSSMQFVATKGCRALCAAWHLDDVIPADAMDLLENMLVIDPAERWTIQDVVNHAYVRHNPLAHDMLALHPDLELRAAQPAAVPLLQLAH